MVREPEHKPLALLSHRYCVIYGIHTLFASAAISDGFGADGMMSRKDACRRSSFFSNYGRLLLGALLDPAVSIIPS
jgi:hypothetical protein